MLAGLLQRWLGAPQSLSAPGVQQQSCLALNATELGKACVHKWLFAFAATGDESDSDSLRDYLGAQGLSTKVLRFHAAAWVVKYAV